MKLKEFIKSVEKVQAMNEKMGSPLNASFTLWNITRTKPDTSGPKLGWTSTTQKLLFKSARGKISGDWAIGINHKTPSKIIEVTLPKYGMTGITDINKLTKEFLEFEVVRTVRDMYNWYTVELEDKLTESEEDAYAATLIRRAKKAKATKSPRMTKSDYKNMIIKHMLSEQGFIKDYIESTMDIEFTSKVNKLDIEMDTAAKVYGKDIMRIQCNADQTTSDAPFTLLRRLYTSYGEPQIHMPPALTHRYTEATMKKQVMDFLSKPKDERYGSVIHLVKQASRRKASDIHMWKVSLYKQGYIKAFKGVIGPEQQHVEISKELEEEWGA